MISILQNWSIILSKLSTLDRIREDYETVKPESNLFYYGEIGILIFSFVKGLFVIIDILSQIFWHSFLLLGHNVTGILWMDIQIKILLFITGSILLLNSIKRNESLNIGKFWFVLLAHLIFEILRRSLVFFIMPIATRLESNISLFGEMQLSNVFCGIMAILMMTIVSSYFLFKLKRNENRYV